MNALNMEKISYLMRSYLFRNFYLCILILYSRTFKNTSMKTLKFILISIALSSLLFISCSDLNHDLPAEVASLDYEEPLESSTVQIETNYEQYLPLSYFENPDLGVLSSPPSSYHMAYQELVDNGEIQGFLLKTVNQTIELYAFDPASGVPPVLKEECDKKYSTGTDGGTIYHSCFPGDPKNCRTMAGQDGSVIIIVCIGGDE